MDIYPRSCGLWGVYPPIEQLTLPAIAAKPSYLRCSTGVSSLTTAQWSELSLNQRAIARHTADNGELSLDYRRIYRQISDQSTSYRSMVVSYRSTSSASALSGITDGTLPLPSEIDSQTSDADQLADRAAVLRRPPANRRCEFRGSGWQAYGPPPALTFSERLPQAVVPGGLGGGGRGAGRPRARSARRRLLALIAQ